MQETDAKKQRCGTAGGAFQKDFRESDVTRCVEYEQHTSLLCEQVLQIITLAGIGVNQIIALP
jgi:hypothetical protein